MPTVTRSDNTCALPFCVSWVSHVVYSYVRSDPWPWVRNGGEGVSYSIHDGPPKPRFLEVSMVNNLVFRWPRITSGQIIATSHEFSPPKGSGLEGRSPKISGKSIGW